MTLEKLSRYVSKTFTSAGDFDPIFNKFTTPVVTKPVNPDSKDVVEAPIFSADITDYVKKRNTLNNSIKHLYYVICGQSNKLMRFKIIGIKYFSKIDNSTNSAALLLEIKSVSY